MTTFAEQLIIGEEDLIELGFTTRLFEWPPRDSRRLHVDEKVAQPTVFLLGIRFG